MENSDLYETFIGHRFQKKNNKHFNFNLNKESSFEVYLEEFEKFIAFTDFFFSQDGILVTMINSHCYILDTKMLSYVYQLYSIAEKLDEKVYFEFISEYLFTYRISILSKLYNQKITDLAINVTWFNQYFPKRMFNTDGQILLNTYNFYVSVINYSKENKRTILPEVMDRMLSKFKQNLNEYSYIFDQLLIQNRFHEFLAKRDYDLNLHNNFYRDYIILKINDVSFSDELVEVIKIIAKISQFDDGFMAFILNKFILRSNNLCEKVQKKDVDIISNIVELEKLLKHLNILKSINYGNNQKQYKSKIQECVLQILFFKRQLLNDEDYSRRNLKEVAFSFSCPKPDKSYRMYFEENILNLYNLIKQDFNKILEDSLKSYSEHPMIYLISDLSIDTKNNLYTLNENCPKTIFSDYYEKKGIELTLLMKDHLMNVINENYYAIMMKYLGLSFSSSISLVSELLKEDMCWLTQHFREILGFESKVYENSYILLSKCIISIEYYLYNIAKTMKLDIELDTLDILANIFRKNVENDEFRNGFQFVNFVLYDENGPKLRNKLLHGEAINSADFSVQSILIFACVVFLNYYMSREKLL